MESSVPLLLRSDVRPKFFDDEHVREERPKLLDAVDRRETDVVIAYEDDSGGENWQRNAIYRAEYIRQLERNGLVLEKEEFQLESTKTLYAIKIHAPLDLLYELAEVDGLRLPLKDDDDDGAEQKKDRRRPSSCYRDPMKLEKYWQYSYDDENKLELTAPFSINNREKFRSNNSKDLIPKIQRIRLVLEFVSLIDVTAEDLRETASTMAPAAHIFADDLEAIKHIEQEIKKDGNGQGRTIGWLIAKGVFNAVYPIHDGDLDAPPPTGSSSSELPPRQWLRLTWANFFRCHFYQPLDAVKDYFGEQIGFYFAWLGFYTRALFIPAVIGLAVFLFGLTRIAENQTSNEVCGKFSNLTVCRLCPQVQCHFGKVGDACGNARFSSVFDNIGTVIFAFAMSVWSVTFLKSWKRREAHLAVHWHVHDVDTEGDFWVAHIRSEYRDKATKLIKSKITGKDEFVVPTSRRNFALIFSISVVVGLVAFVLALVVGTVIFKIVMGAVIVKRTAGGRLSTISPQTIANVTATVINTVCILILSRIYQAIARRLTDLEAWKTENEFEKSYAYKMFAFEFVNLYSFLFYAAFIQGNLGGQSPDTEETFFAHHCFPHACYSLVSIQLIILFSVKQAKNNIMELGVPMVRNCLRKPKKVISIPWVRDYMLNEQSRLPLFDEYFEMVMQFGFVTMFVVAFPLAPLLAFLNNVLEIRLDAYKFVAEFGRPFPSRVRNTSVWLTFLHFLSYLAVATNALLIAFTTQFIDRFYYHHVTSSADFFHTYMSKFETSSWNESALRGNITECWFLGMSKRSADAPRYVPADGYWLKITLKLAFVIAFTLLVFVVTKTIETLVSDKPDNVVTMIKRERYLANQELRTSAKSAQAHLCTALLSADANADVSPMQPIYAS